MEELFHVLWAYHRTTRRSTGQTPYSLASSMEVAIPIALLLPTLQTQNFDPNTNESTIKAILDSAEDKRDWARIRIAAYQSECHDWFYAMTSVTACIFSFGSLFSIICFQHLRMCVCVCVFYVWITSSQNSNYNLTILRSFVGFFGLVSFKNRVDQISINIIV